MNNLKNFNDFHKLNALKIKESIIKHVKKSKLIDH